MILIESRWGRGGRFIHECSRGSWPILEKYGELVYWQGREPYAWWFSEDSYSNFGVGYRINGFIY